MISERNIPSLIGRPIQNIMMGKATAFYYSEAGVDCFEVACDVDVDDAPLVE